MRSFGSLMLIALVPACMGGTITGDLESDPGAEEGEAESAPITGARMTSYLYYGSCSVGGTVGDCIDTDYEGCYGDLYSGACPGGSNILCCVTSVGLGTWSGGDSSDYGAGYSCNVGGYSGSCINSDYDGCYGDLYSGACPGGSNILCCVDGWSDWDGGGYDSYDPYGGGSGYGSGYSCSVGGYSGTCIDTDYEGCWGDLYAGSCPGGSNILCCL